MGEQIEVGEEEDGWLEIVYSDGEVNYISAENVELIRKGVIDPKDFYSHVRSVEDIQEVVQLVADKKAIKVILTLE